MKNNNKVVLQEVGFGGMNWIELAQDRFRWWALVNAVMTFRFRKMRGINRLAENCFCFSRWNLLHDDNRIPLEFMHLRKILFNPLKPNDAYRRRTAPLTSKFAFYIFIQQI